MNYKIKPNFILIIIVIIVGSALFKQIDFKALTIEKPALSLIYAIVFFGCLVLMIKKSKQE